MSSLHRPTERLKATPMPTPAARAREAMAMTRRELATIAVAGVGVVASWLVALGWL